MLFELEDSRKLIVMCSAKSEYICSFKVFMRFYYHSSLGISASLSFLMKKDHHTDRYISEPAKVVQRNKTVGKDLN